MAYHKMTLDPPYRLGDDQVVFTIGGWTEVDDEARPDVGLTVNGRPVAVETYPRPQVRNHFPGLQVRGVRATVDFRELLAGADAQQACGGFLVEALFRSDHRERVFEYAVSPGWMAQVFGAGPKPKPVPPEALQIRVTGAAAGEFSRQGLIAAKQIEGHLAEAGFDFPAGAQVLDFGCGCGRVMGGLSPRHRDVAFDGCDIDAEAIAWCAEAIGDLATFRATPHLPPLPYADARFDAIYSLSTFTHLPEAHQFAWLDELARVLKPGGLLLTTVANPAAYELPEAAQREARAAGFVYLGDAGAVDGLPDFYRLAFHTHDYVRRRWTRSFEVLRLGAHDLNDTQDSVLLRRV